MLLALACGVAIMLAGAVFLFQLSTQDEIDAAVPVGEMTQVGDMSVTVVSSQESGGVLRVSITIGGTSDDRSVRRVPADRVGTPGRGVIVHVPGDRRCGGSAGESCSIDFDVAGADGSRACCSTNVATSRPDGCSS